MKTLKSIILPAMIIILIMSLSACSSRNDNENPKQLKYSLAVDEITNGKIIGWEFNNNDQDYYTYDLTSDKQEKIGTASEFATCLTNSVLMNGLMYKYVAEGGGGAKSENVLLIIDYERNEMEVLSKDSSSSPIVFMFVTSRGLLALKYSWDENHDSYFELLSPVDGSVLETFKAPEGEYFENAAVSGDSIYVLVYRDTKTSRECFIREYSDSFTVRREISLGSIADFAESGINRMEMIGEYIYMMSIDSNCGLLAKITDPSLGDVILQDSEETYVFEIMRGEDLFMASGSADASGETYIFYKRYEETDNCFLFNHKTGEQTMLDLNLDSGYTIQSIYTGGDYVVVDLYSEYKEERRYLYEEVIQ